MNTTAEINDSPGSATMEEGVPRLEAQADAFAEVIEELARGLEGSPTAELQDKRAEKAARRAHELRLLARLAPSDRF